MNEKYLNWNIIYHHGINIHCILNYDAQYDMQGMFLLVSNTKTVQKLSPATFWNVQICHLQINVIKYHGISIHYIQNSPGTKRNIFLHLRCWIWQAKHVSIGLRTRKQSRNYHQPNFNLLYLRKLPWAHSIFCTSLVDIYNDLATEKKLSKFGTTLFGYLNSKVKVNDLYILFYLNCRAMYISS